MIPVYFDGPASPEKERERAIWRGGADVHNLPLLSATHANPFSDDPLMLSMWTITLDYGFMLNGCVKAYRGVGADTYVWVEPDAAYYAMMGQLMALLSTCVVNKVPPKFTLAFTDEPELMMETTVGFQQIDEIARKAEQSLPAFRVLVDAAMPGLSVSTMNIKTGAENPPIRPVVH